MAAKTTVSYSPTARAFFYDKALGKSNRIIATHGEVRAGSNYRGPAGLAATGLRQAVENQTPRSQKIIRASGSSAGKKSIGEPRSQAGKTCCWPRKKRARPGDNYVSGAEWFQASFGKRTLRRLPQPEPALRESKKDYRGSTRQVSPPRRSFSRLPVPRLAWTSAICWLMTSS